MPPFIPFLSSSEILVIISIEKQMKTIKISKAQKMPNFRWEFYLL